MFGVVSAIRGIQSFSIDSRAGTRIWYWHGYERLYAVALAVFFAAAFYTIYWRCPIAWKLGWAFIYLSAAEFAFEAWRSLGAQPYGWVGASVPTGAAVAIALYWGGWWRSQKSYFLADGDEKT